MKKIYVVFFVSANLIYGNMFYLFFSKIFSKKYIKKDVEEKREDELNLLIGYDEENKKVFLPESGLYQNFLITGTIGSGKTSSAMYPFTKQLFKFNSLNPNKKIGMLILDVKGNYYKQVKEYARKYGFLSDLKVIELGGKIKYNPLHKPNLKPAVIANRLKTILTLFSENNSESYWLDKAEQVLTEAIKLCRMYNKGYVNFKEIHRLVNDLDYYKQKVMFLRKRFLGGYLSDEEIYNLNSALDFFQNEYEKLDQRTLRNFKVRNN